MPPPTRGAVKGGEICGPEGHPWSFRHRGMLRTCLFRRCITQAAQQRKKPRWATPTFTTIRLRLRTPNVGQMRSSSSWATCFWATPRLTRLHALCAATSGRCETRLLRWAEPVNQLSRGSRLRGPAYHHIACRAPQAGQASRSGQSRRRKAVPKGVKLSFWQLNALPALPRARGAIPLCGRVWSRNRQQRGVSSRLLLPSRWSRFGRASSRQRSDRSRVNFRGQVGTAMPGLRAQVAGTWAPRPAFGRLSPPAATDPTREHLLMWCQFVATPWISTAP